MKKFDNSRKKIYGAISNRMRKILPHIFFVLVIVGFFAPIALYKNQNGVIKSEPNNASAKAGCAFVTQGSNLSPEGTKISKPNKVTLKIKTTNCEGEILTGNLWERDALSDDVLMYIHEVITGNETVLEFTPGENDCEDGECKIGFRLFIQYGNETKKELNVSTGGSFGVYNSANYEEMSYMCPNGQCDDTKVWKDHLGQTANVALENGRKEDAKQAYQSTETSVQKLCDEAKNNPNNQELAKRCQSGLDALESSKKNVDFREQQAKQAANLSPMPGCHLLNGAGLGEGTFMGCIAQAIYYVLFVPTSYLFALAGQFFDWTFAYSISDASYKIPFVVQGWGILRDFVNMFFIFVLLYIAFRTILGVHGAKTKDLIINVIIIGLLINFSLFTTQVIIDASNILARVFYSDDAIKLTAGPNRGALDAAGTTAGPNGEIQLSAALVDKVNPQNLILNSKKVNDFGTTGNDVAQNNNAEDQETLDAGSFILITILAIAINIVGLITFLSVGLIFVARVIGLWFAMIFAPIAFFSYTVPSLANNKTFGFHHWLEELLKMAFLAPIFIFFLYLILQFLEGLNFVNQGDQTGVKWVIAIVVPFIFIMVLLQQAKSIAQKFSGELGQKITGAISAAGGLAIGGAALGAAALGRQTLGAVAKYAQNDGARKGALQFKGVKDAAGKIKGWNTLNPFAYLNVAQKAVGGVGKAAMAGVGTLGALGRDASGKSWFQRQTAKLGDKTHSAHVLDEYAQKITGDKTTKYSTLDEGTQKRVQDGINKDNISKAMYNKVYDKLSAVERTDINTATGGDWTVAGSMAHTMDPSLHTGEDMAKTAGESVAVSEFVNALRKGSYDVRNISQMKTSSKGLAGAFVGTSSFIADQMRNTIMKNVGVSYGKGEKDFGKDLKNAITEAIKNANIKVQVSHDSGGHDDHGGGHDDHGGGGHH